MTAKHKIAWIGVIFVAIGAAGAWYKLGPSRHLSIYRGGNIVVDTTASLDGTPEPVLGFLTNEAGYRTLLVRANVVLRSTNCKNHLDDVEIGFLWPNNDVRLSKQKYTLYPIKFRLIKNNENGVIFEQLPKDKQCVYVYAPRYIFSPTYVSNVIDLSVK